MPTNYISSFFSPSPNSKKRKISDGNSLASKKAKGEEVPISGSFSSKVQPGSEKALVETIVLDSSPEPEAIESSKRPPKLQSSGQASISTTKSRTTTAAYKLQKSDSESSFEPELISSTKPLARSQNTSTQSKFFDKPQPSSSARVPFKPEPKQAEIFAFASKSTSQPTRTFITKPSAAATSKLDKLKYKPPSTPTSQFDEIIPPTQTQSEYNNVEVGIEDDEVTRQKQKRHEAWKAKLSVMDLHRRWSDGQEDLGQKSDEEAGEDVDVDEKDEVEAVEVKFPAIAKLKSKLTHAKGKKRGAASDEESEGSGSAKKVRSTIGPSGKSFTPLEQQVNDLKAEHPGVLLLFEVGYKIRFFGDDADIASRLLNIVAWNDRNFRTASIPVHRLSVHVKNLVASGHKVGIVRQVETAALKKAGANRNAPFTRKMTDLYTASTYIDDLTSLDDHDSPEAGPSNSRTLLAIVERNASYKGKEKEVSPETTSSDAEKVVIGFVAINPGTGEVVYEQFEEHTIRSELETRLSHLRPCELLLPRHKISYQTEKTLKLYASRNGARVERVSAEFDDDYAKASSFISEFYSSKMASSQGVAPLSFEFPKLVILALAQAIRHLQAFSLTSALIHSQTFKPFSNQMHMILSSNTLANLEVYQSDIGGGKGSLFWLINHTKTKMGQRLLRDWLGKPLQDVEALKKRVGAVTELLEDSTGAGAKLKSCLKGVPDLPKGLARIKYGRSEPSELLSILSAFRQLADDLPSIARFNNSYIKSQLSNLAEEIGTTAQCFINQLNTKAMGQKSTLWRDPDKFPSIQDTLELISCVEHDLDQHLKQVRKDLKKPGLKFATVAGVEYLFELRHSEVKQAPSNWVKVSSTKTVVRFHSPEAIKLSQERLQHIETLASVSNSAWIDFQTEVSGASYELFSRGAESLATLDCLCSLATTSLNPGWNPPAFTEDNTMEIEGAFHPVLQALKELDGGVIPNSVSFSSSGTLKIITGPNMGGKSTCVRSFALCVILAQIGCFVPASKCRISVRDSIYTRMGASDNLTKNQSTFLVEMVETSEILQHATSRSLIILDELGRGTATFDGMAVAHATASHLAEEKKGFVFFITHYSNVAEQLAKKYSTCSTWFMGFTSTLRPDGSNSITFLYKLRAGISKSSFGIECGRLADLPANVLALASEKSKTMEEQTKQRERIAQLRRMRMVLDAALRGNGEEPMLEAIRKAKLLLAWSR